MRKMLKLSLVLAILIFLMVGSVYAAITCNVELKTTKNKFDKKEEVTVEFAISNIQSEGGAIALSATLDYDKTSLDLVKMEGQNGWETPIEGASYNESNGKMAIARNGLGKNDETILKMIFEVKDTAKANTTIKLKDVKISDGDGTATFATIKKDITIKTTTQENEGQNPPKTDKEDILLNIESNTNKTKTDNTISTDKLPKAGNANSILPIFILLVVISTTIYTGVKIKSMQEYIK